MTKLRVFKRPFLACQACTRDYRPLLGGPLAAPRRCPAPAEHRVRYDDGTEATDLLLCHTCLDVARLELGATPWSVQAMALVASLTLETYQGLTNGFSRKTEALWRLRVLDANGQPTFADLGDDQGHVSHDDVKARGLRAAAALGITLTAPPPPDKRAVGPPVTVPDETPDDRPVSRMDEIRRRAEALGTTSP